MHKDGWEAERLPWNSLATLKLFVVVVEGVQVNDMTDEDILEEVADVDEVIGGVDHVKTRLEEVNDINIVVDIGSRGCLDHRSRPVGFLPFIRESIRAIAGRNPNDLTFLSPTTIVMVGDDKTGAEASSIKPKFKEDPVRGMNIWKETLV